MKLDGKKIKILVIEDNNIARRMAKVAFEANDCQVDCVTTGNAAIEKFAEGYDLVLLDLGLPDMDGLEVAKSMRQNIPDPTRPVSIIALTAHPVAEKQESTQEAGMNGFVEKPLTMRKCEAILTQYCKKA